jgi:hypothetical protein
LGQSLRQYTKEIGNPDFELEKFAVNSVISATHTGEMSEDDQKDIIDKVKESGESGNSEPQTQTTNNGDVETTEIDSETTETKEDNITETFKPNDIDEFINYLNSNINAPVVNATKATIGTDSIIIKLSLDEKDTWFNNIFMNSRFLMIHLFMDGTMELFSKSHQIKHKFRKTKFKSPEDATNKINKFISIIEDNELNENDDNPCWSGYEIIGTKIKNGKEVPNCVPISEVIEEAKYQGREVKLNKPMRGDVKKYKVYVKNDKGNVVKVNFGDPDMEIKRDDPERRKSFRARHKCDNPGPKWKARYWSCKFWSTKSVSDLLNEETNEHHNMTDTKFGQYDRDEYLVTKENDNKEEEVFQPISRRIKPWLKK